MSRVRQNGNWRTAAAYNSQGSGCSSFYWLPPLSVLFFGVLIALAATHIPSQAAVIHGSNTPPSNGLASLFTPEVQYWKADILRWSEAFNLDPNLVTTIMQIESCGNASARSSAGAMGTFSGHAGSFRHHGRSIRPRYQRPARIDVFATCLRQFKAKYFMVAGGL